METTPEQETILVIIWVIMCGIGTEQVLVFQSGIIREDLLITIEQESETLREILLASLPVIILRTF